MAKRALIIGIDKYNHPGINDLSGAVKDARAMEAVLATNEDGSPNYDCRTYTSPGAWPVTRGFLRGKWDGLFSNFDEEILFYFAGHGTPTDIGGFLVTQDAGPDDPGLSMQELVDRANKSNSPLRNWPLPAAVPHEADRSSMTSDRHESLAIAR